MDRGAWQATVHGFAELDMTERLNNTGIIVNSKGERKVQPLQTDAGLPPARAALHDSSVKS